MLRRESCLAKMQQTPRPPYPDEAAFNMMWPRAASEQRESSHAGRTVSPPSLWSVIDDLPRASGRMPSQQYTVCNSFTSLPSMLSRLARRIRNLNPSPPLHLSTHGAPGHPLQVSGRAWRLQSSLQVFFDYQYKYSSLLHNSYPNRERRPLTTNHTPLHPLPVSSLPARRPTSTTASGELLRPQ